MKKMVTKSFILALNDYYYFIQRNYSRNEINRIVGNHYQLTRIQRSILVRGITSSTQIAERNNKKALSINNEEIYIDGFNVFYTLTNYLMGRTVLVANDGFLRDTGEVTGKNQSSPHFIASINHTINLLVKENVKGIFIIFDEPVSHSGNLAALCNKTLETKNIKGWAKTVKSPDTVLKSLKKGVIATSDSAILDSAQTKIFDLSGYIIHEMYRASLMSVSELINNSD